jgi:hypothetical protein
MSPPLTGEPGAPSVEFAGSGFEPTGSPIAPDELQPDPFDRALGPAGPGRLTARADQPFLWTWRDPGPAASTGNRIATSNAFGQSMSFLVQDVMRDPNGTDWVRIRTGEFPNGAKAWVRAADVRLATVDQRIVIDLSKRRLVRYIDGKVHTKLKVAIGDEDTPTVPGRYFVWARVRYATTGGPYGKLALGLSGFSEVVRFGPSPGRLAIHGTSDPSDRRQAVSLGCVRVYNAEIERLWSVPMGTPVLIQR